MKTLTIVLPLFNEEKRVESAFKAVSEYRNSPNLKVEKFVFVNDGSRDQTLELLKKFQKNTKLQNKAKIEIVSYPVNRGRGYAVMQGVKRVETDYGMFMDGDMSIPLSNLKNFSKFMGKNIDVLIGSKKLAKTVTLVKRSLLRDFIGSTHSFILSKVLGIKLADFTGGFKVFSSAVCKNVFPRLTQERWGLDPEVIYISNKMGFKVVELPIVWSHVSTSSKVNLIRDILRAFKEMATIRLNDLKDVYGLRPSFQPSFLILRKIASILVE